MKNIYLIFLLLHGFSAVGNSIFVNKAATGLKNGSSWKNAFTSLQDALALAKSGDSIKVAEGTYLPAPTSERSISFIIRRGTVLLGGYASAGGDTTDARRNWVSYPTVLSGQVPGFSESDCLLYALNIDTATVVDGFITRYASASGSSGAGISVVNSSKLFIRNIVFEKLANTGIYIINSSPVFTNCVVTSVLGKAISNASNSDAAFYNCIITLNNFGGIADYIITNENASVRFINSVIVNNSGTGFYGKGTGTATLQNCIIWNNHPRQRGFEDNDIVLNNHSVNVSNCITQTYFENGSNTLFTTSNPRFIDETHPAGPDNKFFTADDGLQLTAPCSPAINAGNNNALTGVTKDITGKPRAFNGGAVDLGPYELQVVPGQVRKTVFVNNSASNTGNDDGSSWQHAYKTLQKALLYCADTIKVSAGVYLTSSSYADSIFILENKKVLLGGYPSTGNPSDADRNPLRYRTTLKCNFTGPYTGLTSHVLKSYHNDSTTIVDGFSFDNQPLYGSAEYPALLIGYASRPRVRNCDFIIPSASYTRSAGVQITHSSAPQIYRCTFNTYFSGLGGAAINCYEGANPAFSYCSFIGNKTASQTGISIAFRNSSATMDSCTFLYSVYSAGSLAISADSSNLIISNCLFTGNLSTNARYLSFSNKSNGRISNTVFKFNDWVSSAVYNNNSSPVFTHCLFDSGWLAIENVNRSAPVFNNCVSINSRFMKNKLSFPVLNNCTIVNTYRNRQYIGTTSESALITNEDSTVLRANNTIFWTNRLAPGDSDIIDRPWSILPPKAISILNNCLTQNYGTDGVNGNRVGFNPRFRLVADIDGPDNRMFTPDDGIILAPCSPAINAGNNALGSLLPVDVMNKPRIYNTNVDMGAYELQENAGVSGTYYVDAGAVGNNSGSSWQHAYPQLQTALCNACADTIKVAAGTYKPAVSSRDSSFYINRPITLLGGYPVSGNRNETARDPLANPTVLSGNIGNPSDSTDNSALVVAIDAVKDSVVVDGFEVRDGYSYSGGIVVGTFGAGISTYYNHTHITNCRFINNRGSIMGGGLFIGDRASSYVSNCIFSGNTATNYAGALALTGNTLNLANCVFENNHAFGRGGAVGIHPGESLNSSLRGTYVRIWNCVFYNNHTTGTVINNPNVGGAVYATSGIGGINNCTFVKNQINYPLPYGGAGLYTRYNLNLPVKNCIFWNNSSAGSVAIEGSDMDWPDNYNYVSNCLLQSIRKYALVPNLYGVSPLFADSSNPSGKDGRWFTADDGLQLTSNSAAVNYGANAVVTGVPYDILGKPRIIQNTVDAGAYEYQDILVANAGGDTVICKGASVQIGKPGNPSYMYAWTSYPAGFSSNTSTPTVTPAVTTTYYLEVSNAAGAVARDTMIVSLVNALSPLVSITSSATTICEGTAVTCMATVVNGGTAPSWQWQVNGVNTGTNNPVFTATGLTNGSQIKVSITTGGSCITSVTATSNVIAVTVNPKVAPSVSISVPATSICSGSGITFTANPVNGGTAPTYTWKKNGANTGTNINTYSTVSLANGDAIAVTLTSNAACRTADTVSSNPVSVVVNPVVTPSISISGNTTVSAGQSVLLTASVINSGTGPTYLWEDSTDTHSWQNVTGTTAATLNYTPSATGVKVRCLLVVNTGCVTSASVNSNTLAFTLSSVTGIADVPGAAYSIIYYPNPVNTLLTIDSLRAGDQWQQLTITDINGQLVMQQDISGRSKVIVNVGHLSTGVFVVSLKRKSGKMVYFRFIKT